MTELVYAFALPGLFALLLVGLYGVLRLLLGPEE